MRAALRAQKMGKCIIYDSDDHDLDSFNEHYTMAYASGVLDNVQWFVDNAHGFTVGSDPLSELYPNSCVIGNGFDVTLPQFQRHEQKYWERDGKEHYKIVWGGSTTHARDFEVFFKLGVLDDLLLDYPVDVYIHGLHRQSTQKNIGKNKVVFTGMGPQGIEWYIHNLYYDASFLFAPLVQDNFNGYRSTLKLVEAGVAGKAIVASRVKSYETYEGRDGVVLVDNTHDQWYNALKALIEREDHRRHHSEINYQTVQREYNAQVLTDKRIKYYSEVLNAV
jgi:glycosyltransferase involved in cell wall biosynthesis